MKKFVLPFLICSAFSMDSISSSNFESDKTEHRIKLLQQTVDEIKEENTILKDLFYQYGLENRYSVLTSRYDDRLKEKFDYISTEPGSSCFMFQEQKEKFFAEGFVLSSEDILKSDAYFGMKFDKFAENKQNEMDEIFKTNQDIADSLRNSVEISSEQKLLQTSYVPFGFSNEMSSTSSEIGYVNWLREEVETSLNRFEFFESGDKVQALEKLREIALYKLDNPDVMHPRSADYLKKVLPLFK